MLNTLSSITNQTSSLPLAMRFCIKVPSLKYSDESLNGSFERGSKATPAFKSCIFCFTQLLVLGQKWFKEHQCMLLIGAPYLPALASEIEVWRN